MSTLASHTVTSLAAVKIVDTGAAAFVRIGSFGGLVYLGADNTVTAATGVPMDPDGEQFQFTADHEVWAIAKSGDVSVRVLSWA